MKIKYKIKEWDNILRPGDMFAVKQDSKKWNALWFKGRMYKVAYIIEDIIYVKWKTAQGGVCDFTKDSDVLDHIEKIHPKDYHKYKYTEE